MGMMFRTILLLLGALVTQPLLAFSATSHSAQSIETPLIAFVCPSDPGAGICTIRADGTDLRRLTNVDSAKSIFTDKAPVWSPDGKHIAFLSNRGRDDNNLDIFVIEADGSNIRRVTHTPRSPTMYVQALPPQWSTDGKRLAYIEGSTASATSIANFWVVNADGSGQRRLEIGKVPNGVFHWLSDGSIAFLSERKGTWALYSVNARGSNIRLLMKYGQAITSAALSPDRKRIAFSSGDSGIILYDDLYVSDADGYNVRRLTHDPRVGAQRFAWSPDNQQIAFTVRQRSGMSSPDVIAIYVINADGTNQRKLNKHGHHNDSPAWSPDGGYIAFHSYGGAEPAGIYVMNADGSNERFLVAGAGHAWKPCSPCPR